MGHHSACAIRAFRSSVEAEFVSIFSPCLLGQLAASVRPNSHSCAGLLRHHRSTSFWQWKALPRRFFGRKKKMGMPATFRVLAYIPFFKKKTKNERFPLTDSSVFSVIQCTAEPTALVYVPASVKKPAVRSANCYGCMAVVIE